MKKFLSIVSFLVLFSFNAVAGPKVGEITGQMGTTWNEREGQTENVIMGYELQMNDFLQTGEDGGMILSYVDGSKFTMGPNAETIIDEFAFDTSAVPIEVAMNVTVNVGSFTYESGSVSELGGDVTITTATATVTMQGTAISGTVAANGQTTIILLPDSDGDVGQVTVSNEAGSQILTNPYTAVTVFSENVSIKAPSPLGNNEKKNLFDLDSAEELIEEKEKFDNTKELIEKNNEELIETIEEIESNDIIMEDETKSKDVEMEMDEAQELEESIVKEELSVSETETITTTDMAVETETMDTKSSDSFADVEDIGIEEDVDTSYYDDFEDDLKDWGYIDDDNQISVWDAEGEKTMDWDEAKSMYAEMDQAYFDAIGCSDCTWDTINWDEVNWDDVDWDTYMDDYNDLLEKYGLTSWDMELEEDKTEEVLEEATETIEGYTWEDFMLDDEYYNNSDYISAGGPPELTIENYCDYNGYDLSWCDQSYLDYLNEWYADDWSLFKDYTSWEKGAKKLFKKWYGWCGQWPDYEWCEGQPKPWKIDGLKDKYISEWDWNDWDKFYQATYDWWYTGTYDDSGDDQSSWEEEYEYEDEYDADLELEQWLSDIDNEWDCDYYGYYWDKANQKCGTEWVDNSQAETAITTSGETLNYATGDITQTVTTTDGATGATSSVTQTGRYTTGNNSHDVTATTSGDYTIVDRDNDNHRAYVKIDTSEEIDLQIMQDKETQNFKVGSNLLHPQITIIQTD